jgi:ribA/ribD-fused uncharacterized protein
MDVESFTGEFFFLSNMYPCRVVVDGMAYPSVENAFQAMKTDNREDRVTFQSCKPKEARRLGRKLKLRDEWEMKKLGLMEALVRYKFTVYGDLTWALTQIDGEIVEGNCWHDTFWGKCDGVGENFLGKILMDIRDDVLKGKPRGY